MNFHDLPSSESMEQTNPSASETNKEHRDYNVTAGHKEEVKAAIEKLRDERIENFSSSVVRNIGSMMPSHAVNIKKELVHYAETIPSLGSTMHEFIRNLTARVKGKSAQDKISYDLNKPQGAADKLCSKYSKEEIKDAIDYLNTHNDPRFKANNEFSFNADDFYNNHIINNKNIPSKQQVLTSDPIPDFEDIGNEQLSDKELSAQAKTRKEIGNTLAALVERKPVIQTFIAKNGVSATLTQAVGHIESEGGVSTYVKGKTSSAEGQKTERVNELANQGSVVLKVGYKSKLVVGRSARTSSDRQIKESSMGIISDKFQAEGEVGFIAKKDGSGQNYYEFQKTDISFMDTSRLKQIFSRLTNARNALFRGRPLEDECMLDGRHLAAIEKTWDPVNPNVKTDSRGAYIEHRINIIEKDGHNSIKTFREYKPLFMNVLISSQANTTSNLRTARERNIPSVIAAGKQLATQLNDQELLLALTNCERSTSAEHIQALQNAINNLKVVIPDKPPLDPKIGIALDGLIGLISGKLKGESIDTIPGTKAQLLYMLSIAELTKMGVSVKCKSGNDRTAIGVSMAVARAQFETVNGKPYDPSNTNAEEDKEFADSFINSMETFGRANVMGSRGPSSETDDRPILKSKSHPLLAYELGKLDSDREVQFNKTVNLI